MGNKSGKDGNTKEGKYGKLPETVPIDKLHKFTNCSSPLYLSSFRPLLRVDPKTLSLKLTLMSII